MIGTQVASPRLFYDFCLDDHVPSDHLLRRIDQFLDLESVRAELRPFYSKIGRPSIDPELMMRMLIIGSAWAFGLNGVCARKSPSISPIAGSAA
jgi:transposase